MSQQYVEMVKAAVDAWNRRDWDALWRHTAADFELDLTRALGPYADTYRGPKASQRAWESFASSWESVWMEPHEFIEAGEHVVVPYTHHFRGRDGIEVQARAAWVYTFRDGTSVRLCFYPERHDALAAVGLPT